MKYPSLNKTKIVHNNIAAIPKTNTYLNDILVINQDKSFQRSMFRL